MLQKFYLAGVSSFFHISPWLKDLLTDKFQFQRIGALESFWNKKQIEQMFSAGGDFKIFLDSGAYSWHSSMIKQGMTVDSKKERKYLDDYIKFIHKHENRLYAYANLDVVGDPIKSKQNQRYMESNGTNPIPVFHYSPKQGDYNIQKQEFQYLKSMLEQYNYIALGGGASEGLTGSAYTRKFGDFVFDIIEESGRDIKVHGFGIASTQLILRYPWYSVDSTTWIRLSVYGGIFVPYYDADRKQYRYDIKPKPIYVSELGRVKSTARSHYALACSKKEREYICQYLDGIGVDLEQVEKDYLIRQKVNVLYYVNFVQFLQSVKQEKVRRNKPLF